MKHLFVSYDISKRLKALGFDEPCFGRWIKGKFADYKSESQHPHSESALAPTHQQVVDWFREKYKIVIEVAYSGSENNYQPKFRIIKSDYWVFMDEKYDDYYEALNAAIEEALNLAERPLHK